jgi:hypothetical protein
MTEIVSSIEQVVASAEQTWEALEHSGIGEAIPIAGHFVKVWRIAHDARDALFAAKLRAFILEPALQTPEARAQMRERAHSEDSKRVGETLLLVLERLTDMMKPAWLARCFAAYLSGEITASDLRRLAMAIDLAFGDDLLELINSPETPANDRAPWKRRLANAGLTDVQVLSPIGATHTVFYPNDWGAMLRKAVRRHAPAPL